MPSQPNAVEKRHHARIREMPCILCGAFPVSVHHMRHNGRHWILKDHRYVAPLCPPHHTEGKQAIHRIGHPAFFELLGFDLYAWSEREWEVSCG